MKSSTQRTEIIATMKTIINMGMFLVIPVITILVSAWYINEIDRVVIEEVGIGFSELCEIEDPEIQSVCQDEFYQLDALRNGAIYTSIAAILLIASFQFAALICGSNRQLLSSLFPKLVPFVLLGIAVIVIVQAFMLTYAAYWAQLLLIDAWFPIVTGGIGFAGALASLGILRAVWNSFGVKDYVIFAGHSATADDQPELFELVNTIAAEIGGRAPENIVLGLDPTFFAISNPVKIASQNVRLTGETMYLSLPLLRVLSVPEITAIIGHELGHFAGNDTDYSRKFSPVYRSISESQQRMADSENISTLPATITLMNLLDSFDQSVKTISRERELLADEHGASASSGESLIVALLKLSVYTLAWNEISEKVIFRIRNGYGFTANLSWLFQSVVEHNINTDTVQREVETAMNDSTTHPNDSHPTTSVRAEKLGIEIAALDSEKFLLPEETADRLLNNILKVEEELTACQQLYLSALGVKEGESDDKVILQRVISMFAAYITLADGVIDAGEVREAEAIGASLFEDFDFFDFREFCHYPDSMLEFERLLEIASGFTPELKKIIVDMCSSISRADGDYSKQEQQMMERIGALHLD